MTEFCVGVTPDFFTDGKGRWEAEFERVIGSAGIRWEAMPPQPGKIAEPAALDQYDAIFSLGLRITSGSLAGVRRLALVARWGVGYDMIDVPALTEAGVLLAITPGAVRRPVAEAILTFVFALSTNLTIQDRIVRRGGWRSDLPRLGRNIAGRTLGSLGCGNIAGEMFRMASSLGFGRLIAHDPFIRPEQAEALGVQLVSFDELFRESDFLAVNVPLNASTRGLIGESELRRMKPTSYLINTARGPIVDQPALVRALREGWIAGAGLDVFEREPMPAGDPLRELDNVVLSPHGLAWTEELARDNTREACCNIVALARGQLPAGIVNREVVEQPGFKAKLARYRSKT